MQRGKYRKLIVGALETNSYLINTFKGTIIVDPGDINYVEIIKKLKINPIAILLTHCHGDHSVGIEGIQKEFNIPVYISEDEWDFYNMGGAFFDYLNLPETKIDNVNLLIGEQGTFQIDNINFKYYQYSGHTPGSLVYQWENILFVGDLLFDSSIGRYDLFGGDYLDLKESLKRFVNEFKGDYWVCPGHTNEFFLEDVLKNNTILQEVLND